MLWAAQSVFMIVYTLWGRNLKKPKKLHNVCSMFNVQILANNPKQ